MNNMITKTAGELTTSDKIYGSDGYEYVIKKVETIKGIVHVHYFAPFSPFDETLVKKFRKSTRLVTGVKPTLRGITQDGKEVWG